jgi:hypothetical protein
MEETEAGAKAARGAVSTAGWAVAARGRAVEVG